MGNACRRKKTASRNPPWLKQLWFAGCHSDIGGSYLEPESRLSDIALQWMVDELQECIPDVKINADLLNTAPDPLGMQHEEIYLLEFGPIKIKWPRKLREVSPDFPLHPSVITRLKADAVSHLGEMKPYRPKKLKPHLQAKEFFED